MAHNIANLTDVEMIIKLGFNRNEASVYTVLSKEKSAKAGVIINKTGLHRNVVYTALNNLIAKKIVSEAKSKSGKVFTAISPDILIDEFSQKKDLAIELAKNFKKNSLNSQEISVHRGNEEYLQLLTTLVNSIPHGSTKFVLGTGGEDFMKYTMIPIWDKYHSVISRRSVKIKMVAYGSQRKALEPYLQSEGVYDVRYLPQREENPAGIHIYKEIDTVLNIIYSKESQDVTAIMIKSKDLTQGYMNLFDNLWSRGG